MEGAAARSAVVAIVLHRLPSPFIVGAPFQLPPYRQQGHRIHGDSPVFRDEMKMRSGHPAGSPHLPDNLPLLHRVARCDQDLAHVQVGRADSAAVIEEHCVAGVVEVAGKRHDAVVAAAGDRLGRSTIHVLQLESELRASGVALVLLRGGTDTSTPAGIAMFQMLAVFAELECATIRARIKSALAHKRAQGVKLGAPKRLDDAEIRRLKAATPDLSIREIAARCRCSNSAVARVLSM